MPKFETNQVDLNGDGKVILYQRPDVKNPKWQCRISVAGATGYKRFSTKETDRRRAERVALDVYEELYFKVRRGGSLHGKPFNILFQEWVETYPTELNQYDSEMIKRVEQTALAQFGKKSVNEITEADLNEMIRNISGKASGTVRKYRTSMNHLMRYAKSKGYIETLPNIEAPPLKRNPRPDFSLKDWKILTDYMRDWVSSNTQGLRGKNGLDHKRYRERFYLQHYILIMGNTGIRIGEMRNCRWGDLSSVEATAGDERVLFAVDGKTGKRHCVGNVGVERYIKRIWDFRAEELETKPDMREPIFCHPNGKRIGNYRRGFDQLLDECELRQDEYENNRTLYSLRHTYATMRINEVPIYQLAVNMGTSVEMIELYYSHARTTDPVFAASITKGNQRGTGKALPF